jgi:hypothetical protein
MDLEVIIRDCIDEKDEDEDEEYSFICFEFVKEGGYFLSKTHPFVKLFDTELSLGFHYIKFIPAKSYSISDLFNTFSTNEMLRMGILWSKHEGIIGSIFRNKLLRKYCFGGIGYLEGCNGGKNIYIEHLRSSVIHGVFRQAMLMEKGKLYVTKSTDITITDSIIHPENLWLNYPRMDDMQSPLEIYVAELGSWRDNWQINLSSGTIWVLRRALRRRYKSLPYRERPPIFNPVVDRSYTAEYIEFCINMAQSYVRQFQGIATRYAV